jgi:hypothetical protein
LTARLVPRFVKSCRAAHLGFAAACICFAISAANMSSVESSLAVPLAVPAEPTARPGPRPAPRVVRDPSTVRVLGPTERVALGDELREIWSRRDLLVQLAGRDVRIRYKQAVMGFAWAILMPLLIVGAGTLFRLAAVSMTGAALDRADIGSVILKSFPWAFFSGALGFAVNSVTGSINLVTKIYFPRAILPIAAVGANLFDLAWGSRPCCSCCRSSGPSSPPRCCGRRRCSPRSCCSPRGSARCWRAPTCSTATSSTSRRCC